MEMIVASLFVLTLAGSALADPPATQPAAAYSYNCKITAIGKGTLNVHVLRGHSGITRPVNVDEKTEVVLLGGQPGKLSDLKVGQWIKVYVNPDANNAKEQRVVKIEPGMAGTSSATPIRSMPSSRHGNTRPFSMGFGSAIRSSSSSTGSGWSGG